MKIQCGDSLRKQSIGTPSIFRSLQTYKKLLVFAAQFYSTAPFRNKKCYRCIRLIESSVDTSQNSNQTFGQRIRALLQFRNVNQPKLKYCTNDDECVQNINLLSTNSYVMKLNQTRSHLYRPIRFMQFSYLFNSHFSVFFLFFSSFPSSSLFCCSPNRISINPHCFVRSRFNFVFSLFLFHSQ